MIVMTFYPFKNNSIKKADIVTNRKLDFVEDRVGRGLAGSQAAVALQLGIKIGDHVEDGVKNGTCADSAESVSSRESVPFPPNHVKEPIDSNESHQSDEQLDELNYDFHLYLQPIFILFFSRCQQWLLCLRRAFVSTVAGWAWLGGHCGWPELPGGYNPGEHRTHVQHAHVEFPR